MPDARCSLKLEYSRLGPTKPMIFWSAMRAAAFQRHAIVNRRLEGGCPLRWQRHMAPLRAIYGS